MLKGKKGIIFGIANDHSIAWGIAEKLHQYGADLAITYQNNTLLKRVKPLAEKVNCNCLIECDVSKEEDLNKTLKIVKDKFENIDFIIHAVAYSDKNELNGRYIETSKDNFINSLSISCFSFTKIARVFQPILNENGSLVTLSFYGANKVMPNYNVMGVAKAALEASLMYLAEDLGKDGIRVNAISAGPIKTLAASGIGDFRYILKWNELNSPLRRNVTIEDVGKSGLYLLSDLGSGVTGETIHVDAGYHVVGMKAVDAPDIDVVTGKTEK